MSYPTDLDEISTAKLLTEINRRKTLKAGGCCDYCGRPVDAQPACRFPDRHAGHEAGQIG